REVVFDRFAAVTDDDHDLAAAGFESGSYGVVDERTPRDGVHHLREGALHPGALTRGENHRGRLLEHWRTFCLMTCEDGGGYATPSQFFNGIDEGSRVYANRRGSEPILQSSETGYHAPR